MVTILALAIGIMFELWQETPQEVHIRTPEGFLEVPKGVLGGRNGVLNAHICAQGFEDGACVVLPLRRSTQCHFQATLLPGSMPYCENYSDDEIKTHLVFF